MKFMKLAIPLFVALAYGPAQGLAAPILGTSGAFAVLGGSATTNTGATTITGDYGVSPGTSLGLVGVTLIPPSAVHTPATDSPLGSVAAQAQADLTTAYLGLQGLLATSDLSGQNLGGLNLGPGVYSFDTSADLTGTLTLNAGSDPNALFVFQIGTNLTTASGPGSAVVQISNPGANDAVYWVVGSATIGTSTEFLGNILGLSAIVLQTSATIACGRALNQTPGPVTMDNNTISIGCADVPGEEGSNGLSGFIGTGLEGIGLEFDTAGNVVDSTGAIVARSVAASVPEPGTLMLLGFGLAGLFTFRKRLFPVA